MQKFSSSLILLSLLVGCAKNQTDPQDQPPIPAPQIGLTNAVESSNLNEIIILDSIFAPEETQINISSETVDVVLSGINALNESALNGNSSLINPSNPPLSQSLSTPTVYNILNTSIQDVSESSADAVKNKFGRGVLVAGVSTGKSLKVSNDVVYTQEDTALNSLNVLANDSDSRNEKLSVVSYTQSTNRGLLEQISNGVFKYTPPKDYYGQDQFSYVVSNQSGERASATVSVFISSINDKPVAIADSIKVTQFGVIEFNVLANDKGMGDKVTTSIVSGVSNGVLENNNGQFKYQPKGDFFGSDSFIYQITDANGDVSVANVTLDVQCVSACLQRFSVYWDPSPSSNVAGYNVYVQDSSGNDLEKIQLGKVTSFEYEAVFKGSYYFSISAYDERNFESDRSRVVNSVF